MTIEETKRSLEGLAANLFQRDHPARPWRGATTGATPEERALYRRFAAGMMRERRIGARAVG